MLGRGPDRMKRCCFRVSPIGTDVMGIALRPTGAVCRCVSAADTSLSLSLSLSTPGLLGKKPSLGADRGAHHHLLAGTRRAPGRGVHRSRAAHRSLVTCVGRGPGGSYCAALPRVSSYNTRG